MTGKKVAEGKIFHELSWKECYTEGGGNLAMFLTDVSGFQKG